MWTWLHRAWKWFQSKYQNGVLENTRVLENPVAFYVTAHSCIDKKFTTFTVPKNTTIVFKVNIGNVAYPNCAPKITTGSDWGVQVVHETQECINHKMSMPKKDIFHEQVSDKILRRPSRYTYSRILLHGVFQLPLPKWFDEFPSIQKKSKISKMRRLNLVKQNTSSLKNIIKRCGPGVYFVSCCRVIEMKGRIYRVTSDFVESNNNIPIRYSRKRKRKSKYICDIENLYKSACGVGSLT